jgi:hypothetical protein
MAYRQNSQKDIILVSNEKYIYFVNVSPQVKHMVSREVFFEIQWRPEWNHKLELVFTHNLNPQVDGGLITFIFLITRKETSLTLKSMRNSLKINNTKRLLWI